MRTLFRTAVSIALLHAICGAVSARADVPATQPASNTPITTTDKALHGTIAEIRMQDQKLSDTLGDLEKIGGIQIDVDWAELEKANLAPATKVSCRLRNVHLEKILVVVLQSASEASAPAVDVAEAAVQPNGRILVSTRRSIFAKLGTTQRYPVGDMIKDKNPTIRTELLGQIKSLVTETIDPRTWVTDASTVGATITLDDDTLVISQTPGAHAKIEALFEKLREQRGHG